MAFQKRHQAVGRGIWAQYQAKIRDGGKQGCAAFLDAVKPGTTAYGFSCGLLYRGRMQP